MCGYNAVICKSTTFLDLCLGDSSFTALGIEPHSLALYPVLTSGRDIPRAHPPIISQIRRSKCRYMGMADRRELWYRDRWEAHLPSRPFGGPRFWVISRCKVKYLYRYRDILTFR